MGVERYANGFDLALHEDILEKPYRWVKPRTVFVNSMSDLFHEDVPADFIRRVFNVMQECPQHTFQVLTKRSGRLCALADQLPWPGNVWMGVSVENEQVLHRIEHLWQVPAHVRFLSCEPLLGPLDKLTLNKIHWVIVGGESGPGARPMQRAWIESILNQCEVQGVSFFFKQWGGPKKSRTGRLLHGRTYDDLPLKRVQLQ